MYYCFNVTASIKDNPEAVLIRALEPLENKDLMLKIRKVKIDLTLVKNIWIEDDGYFPYKITETTRVGIDYAEEFTEKLWRFYISENNNVSKK